ncbi:hypothetical protein Q361_1324 [Flavobacterium croceum DSM 17960]|uniref:Uncharacterized protein n=1 Tax=Flavobacterium croceum DSM 17960 TaxID=1121886 RepID=A0A2S4N4R2_9FLAO|nr:hypothetical protein [Flavobacterium croceum]POS00675.1 hypothetical protein Q361_1324 [Flavobacterium croceum DSM 17960]
MTTTKLKYEQRIVAFIDILGFKEIVKQSEKDTAKIELLFSVLEYIKDWETSEKWNLKFVEIEEDAQKKGVDKFDIRGKTNSTSFSDSIVVSVKTDNNINEMTSTLIVNLAYIGSVLMEQGILIRGGITIGDIIHNEKGTVFGQGLIEAYMLEAKSAIYPRIILSDKLIKELNYPLEQKKNRYPYHQYIDRFEDGCVGFHQMNYYQVIDSWTEMTIEKMTSSLSNVRKVIIQGLDISFESPEIFKKYIWLKEQYEKLIILSDYDFNTRQPIGIKATIRELFSHNIHFSNADKYNDRK